MPFVDGLELSRHIYENYPDTRVIILSGYNEFEYAKMAVKYQVMEYVLKPVTVAELSEILLRVKETLSREKSKKESLKKLTGAYNKNLPIIRTRYLNQIIEGLNKERSEEEIRDKLRELGINVRGSCFKTAIVIVENAEEFLKMSPEAKKDLPAFILFNILEEMTEKEENIIVFQDINNDTVILSGDDTEDGQITRLTAIYEECKKILDLHFGLEITFGIGNKVTSLSRINKSYESALSALEYRFLYGDSRILDIRDFGRMDMVKNLDISEDIKKLALAVKINSERDITRVLNGIMMQLRKFNISTARIYIYVQNIIVAISNLLESADLTEESFSEKQSDLLQLLYSRKTLYEVEKNVLNYCLHISTILQEQRDSFGKKQAILAREYIEENYSNPELSLQSICSELSISMSYFSIIFKRYTGETFIEALTKKRMNKSMELLTNTTMKVYEIAERVGFTDPHYFAVTFKKYTGMTPREYAKGVRQV